MQYSIPLIIDYLVDKNKHFKYLKPAFVRRHKKSLEIIISRLTLLLLRYFLLVRLSFYNQHNRLKS